jgi:hypothetical protein
VQPAAANTPEISTKINKQIECCGAQTFTSSSGALEQPVWRDSTRQLPTVAIAANEFMVMYVKSNRKTCATISYGLPPS